jgi:predicted HicB family RNase H-like nuclease
LAGRHADWYTLGKIDDHFDLTDSQESRIEPKVKKLIRTLKDDHLKSLIDDVDSLESRVAAGLKAKDVQWIRSRVKHFRHLIGESIIDDGTWLLANLSKDQIDEIEEDLKEHREEWQERLKEPQKIATKWQERYAERLEEWLDEPTFAQTQLMNKLLEPRLTKEAISLHYAGRIELQDAYLDVLRSQDAKKARNFLKQWFDDPINLRTGPARENYQLREESFYGILTALEPTVTPEQRKHVIGKIKEMRTYLTDFKSH